MQFERHSEKNSNYPTTLVVNSLLYSFYPFLQTKNKKQESGFQQVAGLVTRDIYVFLFTASHRIQ